VVHRDARIRGAAEIMAHRNLEVTNIVRYHEEERGHGYLSPRVTSVTVLAYVGPKTVRDSVANEVVM
jgi:hypothetical protein